MDQRIYIAAYHQSKFGKLMDMTVPQILAKAVVGVCEEIKVDASVIDTGSVGSACNFTLNQQGLLAGLVATVPGLEGKPIESVENACASGGQAVLSVIYKLLGGVGDVGIALGYEKMRDREGKMDGKLIGEVLGHYSHPDERAGKVFCLSRICLQRSCSVICRCLWRHQKAIWRKLRLTNTEMRNTVPGPK